LDARHIITRLRDRATLTRDELGWFAKGLADGAVSDAQAGAFAMAALLNGLGDAGRVALTLAMRDSGSVLRWNLDRPVLDKHSTGGVGDCVSLILAPALVACGAYVPMISGRGLGHTGGTLDKMEAITGLRTDLDEGQLRAVVAQAGCAIVSATAAIAPADKRLYAIRDVTGTVESLDLITASILSKKLAAGLQGLVLDVKTGSGAFMTTPEQAQALARALVDTANAAGCPTTALITDMNQPLAPDLGNALEVAASMRVLTGQAGGRLLEVTAALGGDVLAGAGLATDGDAGAQAIRVCIADGRAAEIFGRMVAAQGGPTRFVTDWARFLPEATVIREVKAPHAGFVTAMDGHAMGLCVVDLGGGRQVEKDRIDPAVGLSDTVELGTWVEAGQPLARIHAGRPEAAQKALAQVLGAMTISDSAQDLPPLIRDRITA
jgi:thymidine phosphorylase